MTCDKQPCECKLIHRQKRIKKLYANGPRVVVPVNIDDESSAVPLDPKQFFGSVFPRSTSIAVKRWGSVFSR